MLPVCCLRFWFRSLTRIAIAASRPLSFCAATACNTSVMRCSVSSSRATSSGNRCFLRNRLSMSRTTLNDIAISCSSTSLSVNMYCRNADSVVFRLVARRSTNTTVSSIWSRSYEATVKRLIVMYEAMPKSTIKITLTASVSLILRRKTLGNMRRS